MSTYIRQIAAERGRGKVCTLVECIAAKIDNAITNHN